MFYLTAEFPANAPSAQVVQESSATILAVDATEAGCDFVFSLRLKNASPIAREFSVFGSIHAMDFAGAPGPKLFTIEEATYSVNAASESSIVISIPWSNLAQCTGAMSRFEIRALVKCPSLDKTWFSTERVFVEFSPLSVQSVPAKIVRFNDLVEFHVNFANPLPTPIQSLSIVCDGSKGLWMAPDSTAATVSLGTVQPLESLSISRSARATKRGPQVVAFIAEENARAVVSEALSIRIVGCLGDLDGGDSVDDADFSIFVQSYDALVVPPADPAADLNRDGIVDDADFTLFVQAYDKLTCD